MNPETNKRSEYTEKSLAENIVARSVHDKLTDDSNSEYSENSSPEKLTEGFTHGKISMDRYNELFRKAYINMIYRSSPTPLKKLGDSIDYNKNQIINKVVGFVERLGIFEK